MFWIESCLPIAARTGDRTIVISVCHRNFLQQDSKRPSLSAKCSISRFHSSAGRHWTYYRQLFPNLAKEGLPTNLPESEGRFSKDSNGACWSGSSQLARKCRGRSIPLERYLALQLVDKIFQKNHVTCGLLS